MAKLSVTVGPLTAEVETGDEVAQLMIHDYLVAYNLPRSGITGREILQAFVRHLAGHVRAAGDSVAISAAMETRREELKAERANLKWGN